MNYKTGNDRLTIIAKTERARLAIEHCLSVTSRKRENKKLCRYRSYNNPTALCLLTIIAMRASLWQVHHLTSDETLCKRN